MTIGDAQNFRRWNSFGEHLIDEKSPLLKLTAYPIQHETGVSLPPPLCLFNGGGQFCIQPTQTVQQCLSRFLNMQKDHATFTRETKP